MESNNYLPSCKLYSTYLSKAMTKFNKSIDECRALYGLFTISQWEELLN
jgi:hypothetical protein